MIHPAVLARLLNRSDVLRLLDDADDAAIALFVAAERTGIGVGDVVADRTVRDAFLHVADRVDETVGFFARRLENVKGQPLRAFRPDAGEALKLLDETDERVGERH